MDGVWDTIAREVGVKAPIAGVWGLLVNPQQLAHRYPGGPVGAAFAALSPEERARRQPGNDAGWEMLLRALASQVYAPAR